MQNSIEANEIGGLDVPNILADRRYLAADFAARLYVQREYKSLQ
jgi:hypothetical protein